MGILRKTIQREVLDALDSSIYTSDDFDTEFGDPYKKESIISITFLHDKSFKFKVEQGHNGGYSITRAPGEIEEEESSYFHSFEGALEIIPEWCREVRNELKAGNPVYKEVDELREIIRVHIGGSSNSSESFSVEEINTLRSNFEKLQERVEQLEKDKVITEKQLQEFTQGLQQVNQDIEYYPKETWVKTATNKLTKVVLSIGKSNEGRKILSDGVRKLLGLE